MAEIEMPVPILGERGDLPENELPIQALRFCQNMIRSRRGTLEIRPGYDRLGTSGPGGRVMGLQHFKTASGTNKVVAANQTGWWEWDGTNWNDISGNALTGSTTQLVRFQVFSVSGTLKLIGVNEADSPKIWDGAAATYSNLGGSPPTPIDIAAAANRVLLLVSPDNVRISDFNDPETWPSTLTVRLPDVGDLMVGMARMNRTSVGIFGENSQYIARAQAGSFPFRFEKISEEIGPLSKAAMINRGGVIYYLADDGIVYRFDGTPARPIGTAMRRFVEQNLNFTNKKMSHAFYVHKFDTIFFLFPGSTDTKPTMGIYFKPLTREMGRLKFSGLTASATWTFVGGVAWSDLSSFTWDNVGDTYPSWDSFGGTATLHQLVGDDSGQVHGYGQGDGSDDGATIECQWEIPLKSYGGWSKNFVPSTYEAFFRKANNATTITPSIGYTDTLMSDPTFETLQDFDISNDQRNDIDLTSLTQSQRRFITVRLHTNAPKGQVDYQGGILQGESEEIPTGPTN